VRSRPAVHRPGPGMNSEHSSGYARVAPLLFILFVYILNPRYSSRSLFKASLGRTNRCDFPNPTSLEHALGGRPSRSPRLLAAQLSPVREAASLTGSEPRTGALDLVGGSRLSLWDTRCCAEVSSWRTRYLPTPSSAATLSWVRPPGTKVGDMRISRRRLLIGPVPTDYVLDIL
jgi:hypothetical protein